MIKFIRKILREALLKESIKEAEFDKGGHSLERIKQRIKSIPDDDLPSRIKDIIFNNLDKIHKTDFKKNVSLAIMIGKFNPNPNSKYYVRGRDGRGYYRILTDEPDSTIKDSTGNEFWVIIRGNVIRTIFLRKSYQTSDMKLNASNLNVDASFKSVDSAIDRFGINSKKNINTNNKKNNLFVININGVKWILNPEKELIFKKNKPSVVYNLGDIIDKLPYKKQEEILSLL